MSKKGSDAFGNMALAVLGVAGMAAVVVAVFIKWPLPSMAFTALIAALLFYLSKRAKAAASEDKRPLHIARERMAPNPIRTPQQTAPQSNDPPPTSNPLNYRHATPFTPEPTGRTYVPDHVTRTTTEILPGVRLNVEVSGGYTHGTWGDDDDDWSDQDWDRDLDTDTDEPDYCPKPVAAILEIQYRDSKGQTTGRQVEVKECDTQNPAGYLYGYCLLRQQLRTFRLDRIVRATDIETGEVIESITEWARRRHEESPDHAMESLFASATDTMRALFYLCKADGRFTQKEKALFLDFCQEKLPGHVLGITDIEKACMQLEIPSRTAYRLICHRLAELAHDERQRIIQVAHAIITSDKTIKQEEQDALDYLTRQLSPP